MQLRRSLTFQLVVFGAPILLALWWAILADLQVNERRLTADARRDLERVAAISAQAVDASMLTADLLLVSLRDHWRLNRGEFERIVANRRRDGTLGEPFGVTVIDREGRVAWSTAGPSAVGLDVSDTENFQALRREGNDGLFVAAPMRPRLIKTAPWVLGVSRSLPMEKGRFGGAIAVTFSPQFFVRLFATSGVDVGSSVAVLRADSVLLARAAAGATDATGHATLEIDYPVADSSGTLFRADRFFAQAEPLSYVRFRSEFDGVERMFASHPVNSYPLRVTVGRSVPAIQAEYQALRGRYLIAGGVASLFFIVGLFWLLLGRRSRARADAQRQQDIAHLRRSEERLTESELTLRELASRQQALREAERKRVAQEVHDELGQRLTVLRMELAMLPRSVAADPAGLLPEVTERLKSDVDQALAIARDIAGRLRPAALDLGLAVAVGGLLEDFNQILGIPCTLENRLPAGLKVDEPRSIAAFRILQEALTNAARHAGATRITVKLDMVDDALCCSVIDDGRGFAAPGEPARGSLGLSGMRERAAAVGGTLEVHSLPGTGTEITARLPLSAVLRRASMVPAGHDPLATVRSE
jgi:signal transduction histidine kinase